MESLLCLDIEPVEMSRFILNASNIAKLKRSPFENLGTCEYVKSASAIFLGFLVAQEKTPKGKKAKSSSAAFFIPMRNFRVGRATLKSNFPFFVPALIFYFFFEVKEMKLLLPR